MSVDDLEAMRDSLRHRGPDDAGIHIGPGVALAHRRLSIVDVAHGHQPMLTEDDRYALVYNGEIYNHPELMPALMARGVRYRTRSDTETLLHLCVLEGLSAVRHARGMFAFAFWDSKERTLLLGRDRFGVKPLYYIQLEDGGLAFASEIKALLKIPGFSAALNPHAMPDFLANHAPSGEETLFRRVKRLPAGHVLLWKAGSIRIETYWDLPVATRDGPRRSDLSLPEESTYPAEFLRRFTESVRVRLMSDVPLGMFLSGGIDSAAITAVMASLVEEPIRTFSVAFREREANELEYAHLVSREFRTVHRDVLIGAGEFFEALPALVWHEDEPLAHPSSVALYFVSRLASEDVKVVLTGEGSDELLAGYNRYRVTIANARAHAAMGGLAGPAQSAARRLIAAMPRTSRWRNRLSRSFLGAGSTLEELFLDNFAVFNREMQGALLTPGLKAECATLNPYEVHQRTLSRVTHASMLDQMLYVDAKTYLQELLMKQDQMSMAASIESRVPFLDHHMAEWLSNVPDQFKLRGMTTKWLLRKAMSGRLPERILKRRKMGFPVPVGQWFRGPWNAYLRSYISTDRALSRGYFDPHVVSSLIDEHERGQNHSERLWALLTFEIWARIFLDGDSVERVTEDQRPLMAA